MVCCYLAAEQSPTLTVQKLIPFQSDAVFSDEDVNNLEIIITDLTTSTDYRLQNIGAGINSFTKTIIVTEQSRPF